MRDTAAPFAVVVAIDGLVFDTLPLRARVVHASLALEQLTVSLTDLREYLPGRALSEVIDLLVPESDATSRDVIALRAQQMYARDVLAGVSLQPDALAWMHAMRARGVRVIGRADSTRRDVERLAQSLSLGDVFTMLRCADDEPRHRGASTLDSAYRALQLRVWRTKPDAIIDAYEASTPAAAIAARYVRSANLDRFHA